MDSVTWLTRERTLLGELIIIIPVDMFFLRYFPKGNPCSEDSVSRPDRVQDFSPLDFPIGAHLDWLYKRKNPESCTGTNIIFLDPIESMKRYVEER